MKKFILSLALVLAFPIGLALAGGNELAYFKIQELTTLTANAITTGDYMVVYDASAGKTKKVDATQYPGTGGGTFTLNDNSGASPSLVFQDGTDETATFSKVDAGNLTVTTVAGDGLQVLTGNLFVGNGTPGETINGEDLYVEGISEFDGTANFDGVVDIAGATTARGDLSGDGGDQFVGFLQNQVAASTTPLTAAQCGSTVISAGAAVQPIPEASTVLGCRYTIVCGTADDLDIDPADGTDVIGVINAVAAGTGSAITPSAGDEIRCTDIGSSITLEATGANLWSAIGVANGAWTDVN
jgi:hypothetical protein